MIRYNILRPVHDPPATPSDPLTAPPAQNLRVATSQLPPRIDAYEVWTASEAHKGEFSY